MEPDFPTTTRCSPTKEMLYPQENGLQFFHIYLRRYTVAHLFFTLQPCIPQIFFLVSNAKHENKTIK